MIIPITIEDEQDVYDMLCALEEQLLNRDAFHTMFMLNIKDSSISYYVYKEMKQNLGLVSIRIIGHLHHSAKIAMIEELYVKEPFRRQGVGAQLFHFAFQQAQQQGCIQLEISSHKSRKRAHSFYAAVGMKCEHLKFTKNMEG